MATRTAYVATQAVGDVLTSANFTRLPGGWVGYVQVTANQTGITTAADLTGLTLTVTANSSRRLRWLGVIRAQSSGASGYCGLKITDGAGTQLQQTLASSHSVAGNDWTYMVELVETPSSGSLTRKLVFGRAGADAGTWQMSAGATFPAFLCCEDVGPSA